MAVKSPWSVKGVSSEDREQAKSAARRAGVPVGVWLSQQIRAHGAAGAAKDVPANTPDGPRDDDQTPMGEAPESHEIGTQRPQSRAQPMRGGPDSRFTFGPGQWSIATEAVESGRISQPPPQPWPAARPPMIAAPLPLPPAQPIQETSPSAAPMMPSYQQGVPMASHWAMPPLAHPMYMAQAASQQQSAQSKEVADTVKALEEKIEELQDRLDTVDSRMNREIEGIEARLDRFDGVAQEIDALRSAAEEESAGHYSTAPVERAVMRLSERLQRIEEAVLPPDSGGGFFSRLFRRR